MGTTEVRIRRATSKDAARISELAQAIALTFIVDDFTADGRARYLEQMEPESIAKRLADGDFSWLIAEHEGAVVGVAAMQGNWHLYHLFVAKSFQRGGLARRLWEILRDEVLARDPPRTFKANVPRYAIGAYARLGFRADGEMRDEKGVRYQRMTSAVPGPVPARPRK
jgi:GNAT superfamily N-acetyltransferase